VKLLFISVDGVQNYLKSLFLPVLAKLQDEKINIEVLEFCPKTEVLRKELKNSTFESKVPVHLGRYFNTPPVIGSFIFIFYGALHTMYVVKKRKVEILMPRSLLAGAVALLVRTFYNKLEIVYESDGLMSDERADFGSWSRSGLIYKIFQAIEKKLVRDSKIVITRTHKAKDILIVRSPNVNGQKIVVIPNGKDADIFNMTSTEQRKSIREKYGVKETDPLLIYVGSIGKQYRPDVMVEVFGRLREKSADAKFLILTPNQEEMKHIITSDAIGTEGIIVDRVDPNEISRYIAAADIGLALRMPTLSQQAVCPLKVIEYLMCGVPVITNTGVGDFDALFSHHSLGYVIQNIDHVDFEEIIEFIQNTIENIDSNTRNSIRNVALNHFELNAVAERYRSVLEAL